MTRIFFFSLVILLPFYVFAQNLNDNCEDATDITPDAFQVNFDFIDCNTAIGTIVGGFGFVEDRFVNATVDAANYGSANCIGFTSTTTDHYPDLWYKTTLHSPSNLFQRVYFNAADSLQVAIYIGQCGNLYQSQCFTLSWPDSAWWQGVELELTPHNAEDDTYIQVKIPDHYQGNYGYFDMCFSWYLNQFNLYYFDYAIPATSNLTSTKNTSNPPIQLTLFPNPANDIIQIESLHGLKRYVLLDMTGKVMKSAEIQGTKATVDISALTQGMYGLRIETDKGYAIGKIVLTDR